MNFPALQKLAYYYYYYSVYTYLHFPTTLGTVPSPLTTFLPLERILPYRASRNDVFPPMKKKKKKKPSMPSITITITIFPPSPQTILSLLPKGHSFFFLLLRLILYATAPSLPFSSLLFSSPPSPSPSPSQRPTLQPRDPRPETRLDTSLGVPYLAVCMYRPSIATAATKSRNSKMKKTPTHTHTVSLYMMAKRMRREIGRNRLLVGGGLRYTGQGPFFFYKILKGGEGGGNDVDWQKINCSRARGFYCPALFRPDDRRCAFWFCAILVADSAGLFLVADGGGGGGEDIVRVVVAAGDGDVRHNDCCAGSDGSRMAGAGLSGGGGGISSFTYGVNDPILHSG